MTRVRAALDEIPGSTQLGSNAVPEAGDTGVVVEIDDATPGGRGGGRRTWRVTLAAAVVAALGIGLLVQLAGRDADDETPAVPVVTTPPTAAPQPTAPVTTAAPRCPNPEGGYSNHCLGALDPGEQRTTTFEPSFTYTVPDGWWNIHDTSGNYVLLPPGESIAAFDLGVADYIGVYASVAAPAGCDEYPDPAVATTVDAYVGWLRAQTSLVVGEPTPVSVGGLDGTQIDVSLADGAGCTTPDADDPSVPVLIGTNSSLLGYEPGRRSDRVDADTRFRLLLFDRPDGTLMVIELADTGDPAEADSWWATAAEITNTFEFVP